MTKYLEDNADFDDDVWTEFLAWSSDAYDRMEKEIRNRSVMARIRTFFVRGVGS